MNRFAQDPVAEPHWQGRARGELWIQRCLACSRAQFYPRSSCASCGTRDPGWMRASGRGVVYAVTRVDRPPVQGEAGGQVLALVELDEGPRLLTHIVTDSPDLPTIGSPVQVEFAAIAGDEGLHPVFSLIKDVT